MIVLDTNVLSEPFAADPIGQSVGLDAITAPDRAFHNNHN